MYVDVTDDEDHKYGEEVIRNASTRIKLQLNELQPFAILVFTKCQDFKAGLIWVRPLQKCIFNLFSSQDKKNYLIFLNEEVNYLLDYLNDLNNSLI